MSSLSLDARMQGCLLGAVIGAELGFARRIHPERFVLARPEDALSLALEQAGEVEELRGRIDARRPDAVHQPGRAGVSARGWARDPGGFCRRAAG